ncbi:dihydrofolate reductase-like domain-containing protein, partial [Catenaria anguillulae PL171]
MSRPRFSTSASTLVSEVESTILRAAGIPGPSAPKKPCFPPSRNGPTFPWITVTWAQSIDARLAGPGGKQYPISGSESFALTHMLRQVHDAILIGAGTLHNDNPRLNVRLDDILQDRLNQQPLSHPPRHPQPVILDARFTISLECNLLVDASTVRPWVIVEPNALERAPEKAQLIHNLGGRVLAVPNSRHNLCPVFQALREQGIESVMVEGGPTVLQSVLDQNCMDAAVVTIAPLFLGTDAPFLGTSAVIHLRQCQPTWTTLGCDTVMACRMGAS